MKQNSTMVIGLTGGIATGKSTVSKIIKEKGYPVIDADVLAREVVEVGMPAYNEIVDYFGRDILNTDLTIDRDKLGKIIFNDDKKRKKLNSFIHPRILQSIKKHIQKYSLEYSLVFVDIPLLIEIKESLDKSDIEFDEVWLVYAREEQQLDRLMKRNNLTEKEAKNRIEVQISIDDKKKFADRIIYNTGRIDETKKIIENNIKTLLKQ